MPCREGTALVQHVDAVAHRHDQGEVVVDEQHTGRVIVADGTHDLGELGHLRLG